MHFILTILKAGGILVCILTALSFLTVLMCYIIEKIHASLHNNHPKDLKCDEITEAYNETT